MRYLRRDPAYWWLPWYRRPGVLGRLVRGIEALLVVAAWCTLCLILWVIAVKWAVSQ